MSFIPSFHFDNPSEKLKPEWCKKVIDYCYYGSNKRSLLHGKKVEEIEEYASGEFSMKPYERLYKSIKKSFVANNPQIKMQGDEIDSRMQFEPLPLIPTKVNAAISVIQKIPIEISVTALDPLAAKKKNEDINFLKNKPKLESDLQDLADQLQIGKVDLGATKHSHIPYSSSPYGMDLYDDEEAEIFANIIYNLGVEVSFETTLQIFYEIKKASMVRGLEIKDQFYFGVSCHSAYRSEVTGLPEREYKHPSVIQTPESKLPDYSDNAFRFEEMSVTPLELFNYFPEEICDEDALNRIVNNKETGYCDCNKRNAVKSSDFGTFKLTMLRFEVRSVDAVGVASKNKGRGFKYFVDPSDKRCTSKLWGQNTYVFYWLVNTGHFFNIHKLDYAYRAKGNESIQNFTTNIYKSQAKSAVELSIKENKKAQIADIKAQYAILMSLPAGKYIDLKYLRGALEGLTDEDAEGGTQSSKYTMDTLLELALERNIILGDTEGFDGKHDGQFKPFMEIAGGLKTEMNGYSMVVQEAKKNISDFTGINEQLTGQSVNPEGLIGMQKLMINSSLNSLYYANEANNFQEQACINTWANVIQGAIEEGGAPKAAIEKMIGDKKVDIIKRLNEVPLHNLGVKVTTSQREEERAKFEARVARMNQQGILSIADEYILDAISNPKDKIALLAIRYNQWKKKQDQIRQEQAQQQQQMIQAQGQNQIAATDAKTQGKIKEVYAKGETQAKIADMMARLGLNQAQFELMAKKMLQEERSSAAVDKNVRTLEAKNNIQQQQPIDKQPIAQ